MTATVLIIGRAGRLRDGLCTVLRTFPGIREVRTVDDFESAFEQLDFDYASVVIVDGDNRLKNECLVLKRMISTHTQLQCIVIANTLQHRASAQQAGVDAVLLRGFSTSTLYNTLVSLAIVPDSSYIGESTRMNQLQSTTGPTSQKP